jgi:hypothetical protein
MDSLLFLLLFLCLFLGICIWSGHVSSTLIALAALSFFVSAMSNLLSEKAKGYKAPVSIMPTALAHPMQCCLFCQCPRDALACLSNLFKIYDMLLYSCHTRMLIRYIPSYHPGIGFAMPSNSIGMCRPTNAMLDSITIYACRKYHPAASSSAGPR